MFWSASKQGWWAYTQKKSGCHCQHATWGIPVSTLGGLKQGSGQICDITNGLPILGHISGRAPVDGPPTHTTDRPPKQEQGKAKCSTWTRERSPHLRAMSLQQPLLTTLNIVLTVTEKCLKSPVHYAKQVCGAERQ